MDLQGSPLSNINGAPSTHFLNGRAALVFAGKVIIAKSQIVISQRPNLIDRYVVATESGFESAFGVFGNLRVWSCGRDQHATGCVQRSNSCRVLLAEAFGVCRGDLFHVSLILIRIGGSRGQMWHGPDDSN